MPRAYKSRIGAGDLDNKLCACILSLYYRGRLCSLFIHIRIIYADVNKLYTQNKDHVRGRLMDTYSLHLTPSIII